MIYSLRTYMNNNDMLILLLIYKYYYYILYIKLISFNIIVKDLSSSLTYLSFDVLYTITYYIEKYFYLNYITLVFIQKNNFII